MRWIPCLALAVTLPVSAIAQAQQVTVGGWVDRVDMANSTITIRTLGSPRTVQVAPNAVVRVNGRLTRLDQLPTNSPITITADKGANDLLRATQIEVRLTSAQPSAASPAGSLVRGVLVGMNIPNNTITVRTVSGDHPIPIGTAPIIVNGARGSTRDLRVGQLVQIERTLPTTASEDFVTQLVRVLPTPQPRAATRNAGPRTSGASGRVRSRVAGSRSTYRSRRSRTGRRASARSRKRRTVVWKGMRFDPTLAGAESTPVTGTVATGGVTTVTPGATAAVVPGTIVTPPTAVVTPGTAVVPQTVITPGTVVVPGTAVVPQTAVVPGTTTAPITSVVPGGAVGGVAPQTTAPDARQQSTATAPTGGTGVVDQGTALSQPAAGVVGTAVPGTAPATGVATPGANVADPRFQSQPLNGVVNPQAVGPVTPGVATPNVAAPGGQTLVTPGAVLPGAGAPPVGTGDPRNQTIVPPAGVLPGAAAPAPGVPNPRFQSPLIPGTLGPRLPAALRPGLRPNLGRPVIVPRAPAAPAPAPR